MHLASGTWSCVRPATEASGRRLLRVQEGAGARPSQPLYVHRTVGPRAGIGSRQHLSEAVQGLQSNTSLPGLGPLRQLCRLTEKYRMPTGSCSRRSKDTAQLATLLSRRRRQLCTLGRLALLLRLLLLTQSFRSAPVSSVEQHRCTCSPDLLPWKPLLTPEAT